MTLAAAVIADDLTFYSLLGVLLSGMWLQADVEKYLGQFRLSHGRLSILLAIQASKSGGQIGSDLAIMLGVSKATVAKMVERLLKDRYLSVTAVTGDKRRKWYTLTEKGRKSIAKVNPGYMARLRIMSANVSPFEKQQLITILSKINFLDPRKTIIREHNRTITERGKEIKERCERGSGPDIDRVMTFLHEKVDLPTTKIVDYYLGTVGTPEGIGRIEHYLFHGTQMQRNYSTLFFARRNDWSLVSKAYSMGLIDYVQAYSR
jgi:DNA-binding MarR family transcriptional regulator